VQSGVIYYERLCFKSKFRKARLRKTTVNRADYSRNTRFSQVIVTETDRLGQVRYMK
jgi:hypothetical protein